MFILLLLLLLLLMPFCITVAVHCKDTRIAVQVRTNKPFNGRIYALGRSETCNIDVVNSDAFRLDLTMGGQDCNTQSVVSCNKSPNTKWNALHSIFLSVQLHIFLLSYYYVLQTSFFSKNCFFCLCWCLFFFRPVSIRIRLCCNITVLLWQKLIRSIKSSALMIWARKISPLEWCQSGMYEREVYFYCTTNQITVIISSVQRYYHIIFILFFFCFLIPFSQQRSRNDSYQLITWSTTTKNPHFGYT